MKNLFYGSIAVAGAAVALFALNTSPAAKEGNFLAALKQSVSLTQPEEAAFMDFLARHSRSYQSKEQYEMRAAAF